jgi:hypothetical protein
MTKKFEYIYIAIRNYQPQGNDGKKIKIFLKNDKSLINGEREILTVEIDNKKAFFKDGQERRFFHEKFTIGEPFLFQTEKITFSDNKVILEEASLVENLKSCHLFTNKRNQINLLIGKAEEQSELIKTWSEDFKEFKEKKDYFLKDLDLRNIYDDKQTISASKTDIETVDILCQDGKALQNWLQKEKLIKSEDEDHKSYILAAKNHEEFAIRKKVLIRFIASKFVLNEVIWEDNNSDESGTVTFDSELEINGRGVKNFLTENERKKLCQEERDFNNLNEDELWILQEVLSFLNALYNVAKRESEKSTDEKKNFEKIVNEFCDYRIFNLKKEACQKICTLINEKLDNLVNNLTDYQAAKEYANKKQTENNLVKSKIENLAKFIEKINNLGSNFSLDIKKIEDTGLTKTVGFNDLLDLENATKKTKQEIIAKLEEENFITSNKNEKEKIEKEENLENLIEIVRKAIKGKESENEENVSHEEEDTTKVSTTETRKSKDEEKSRKESLWEAIKKYLGLDKGGTISEKNRQIVESWKKQSELLLLREEIKKHDSTAISERDLGRFFYLTSKDIKTREKILNKKLEEIKKIEDEIKEAKREKKKVSARQFCALDNYGQEINASLHAMLSEWDNFSETKEEIRKKFDKQKEQQPVIIERKIKELDEDKKELKKQQTKLELEKRKEIDKRMEREKEKLENCEKDQKILKSEEAKKNRELKSKQESFERLKKFWEKWEELQEINSREINNKFEELKVKLEKKIDENKDFTKNHLENSDDKEEVEKIISENRQKAIELAEYQKNQEGLIKQIENDRLEKLKLVNEKKTELEKKEKEIQELKRGNQELFKGLAKASSEQEQLSLVVGSPAFKSILKKRDNEIAKLLGMELSGDKDLPNNWQELLVEKTENELNINVRLLENEIERYEDYLKNDLKITDLKELPKKMPERIFFAVYSLISIAVIGGLIYKLKKTKRQLTPNN